MTLLNAKFIHKLYDYSNLPESTFGQRLKKLRLSKRMSQQDLARKANLLHGMIGSYERDEFFPNLKSIKKLGAALNINILCNEGYSKFLLESSSFKDKLIKWSSENSLTKRDASKLLGISERVYNLWEEGTIMNISTYDKVKINLMKYNLID